MSKIPQNWMKATIKPIIKEGDGHNCEDHKGISLLCAAYKIYKK
jgi:hypothetical protein